MQSTNVRQRKRRSRGASALRHDAGELSGLCRLWPQAGWKGHLRVMIRGWRRSSPVERVSIERTGVSLLQEDPIWFPPAGVLAGSPTGPARSAGCCDLPC